MDPRQFRALLLMFDAIRLSLSAGLLAIAKHDAMTLTHTLAADERSQRALGQAEGMVMK